MDELEIRTPADAARYLANDVLHEYHGMPLVRGKNDLYILLNDRWFLFSATEVTDVPTITRLEEMAG